MQISPLLVSWTYRLSIGAFFVGICIGFQDVSYQGILWACSGCGILWACGILRSAGVGLLAGLALMGGYFLSSHEISNWERIFRSIPRSTYTMTGSVQRIVPRENGGERMTLCDARLCVELYGSNRFPVREGAHISAHIDTRSIAPDQARSYASRGVFITGFLKDFKSIEDTRSIYRKGVDSLRSQGISLAEATYPQEVAGLMRGILIGDGGGISPETSTAFRASGLSHILVASGFNITVLLIFLGVLVRRLPRVFQISILLMAIWFFVEIVGGGAPIIRAAAMGAIGFVSLKFSRRIRMGHTLLGVAALCVALKPSTLLYDLSFQLSFLAVVGIITTQQWFMRKLSRLPNIFFVRDTLSVTLSAMLFTTPIVAANFGVVSLSSPIANILVGPVIAVAMLLGSIGMMSYAAYPTIGIYVAYPGYLAGEWIILTGKYFGGLQWSTVVFELGGYAPWVEGWLLGVGLWGILLFTISREREAKTSR